MRAIQRSDARPWRPIAACLAVILVAGCGPTVVTIEEPPPVGPQLVMELTNRSDRDLTFSYEFDQPQTMSGSGEGSMPACTTAVQLWGEIAGRYELMIDGVSAVQGSLPPGAGAGSYLFVRLRVDPDGEVVVGQSGLVRQEPELISEPIEGCG